MEDAPQPGEKAPRPSLVRLAAIFYGVMLGLAWVWSAVMGRSLLFANAEAAARGSSPMRDLCVGLLAGGIVVLISREFTRRSEAGEALARALGSVLGRLTTLECVVLALFSGVAEEAFFRGALQPLVGWVAASLIFGVVHFVPRREFLPWTGFTILAGFLLGGLFEVTGNLLAPVVTHALVNAFNLRFLSQHYSEPGSDQRARRPG